MNSFPCFLEPEVKRQSAKDIEAATSPGNENISCFAQFVKEGNSHVLHSTSNPFRSAMQIVACVPELNSRKSFSMPSLKITPFSGMRDSRISGDSSVTRPKTSEAPVVFVGKGSRTVKKR